MTENQKRILVPCPTFYANGPIFYLIIMNLFNEQEKKAIKQEINEIANNSPLAPSTILTRTTALITILTELGSFDPDALHAWLNEKINLRTGQKINGHGKNRYIIALKWYLKQTKLVYGADQLYSQFKKYKVPRSPGKAISIEQFEYVVQFAPDELHELAFRVLFETGMRPHELLSVRFSDIKFNAGQNGNPYASITFQDSNPITPSGKNKTGGRTVFIDDNHETLLSLYEKESIRKDFLMEQRVFPWDHGYLSRTFCRMKKDAKDCQDDPEDAEYDNDSRDEYDINDEISLNFRLYDLRHTAITHFYKIGIPDQIIRKSVGWSPASKMPNTYVHIQEMQVTEVFRQFSDKNLSRFSKSFQDKPSVRVNVCSSGFTDNKHIPIGKIILDRRCQ